MTWANCKRSEREIVIVASVTGIGNGSRAPIRIVVKRPINGECVDFVTFLARKLIEKRGTLEDCFVGKEVSRALYARTVARGSLVERSKYYKRMKGLANIEHAVDLLQLVVDGGDAVLFVGLWRVSTLP